jgi:lysozyme family protein
MMIDTYDEAMGKIFEDEGGYSDDAGDPGGPTMWGITIEDARTYWKKGATAQDVRHMPKSVAEKIYKKHYANPVNYDNLPPGIDYAVLDYGVNSGIRRAAVVLQRLVGVPVDGIIGPATVAACQGDISRLINHIYDERLHFLQNLGTWHLFGRGWGRRCREGRELAQKLFAKYHTAWTDSRIQRDPANFTTTVA